MKARETFDNRRAVKSKLMILEIKVQLLRGADNLTAIFEPTV
jgi:hypothetical protein